jgi:hypothetical protein
MAAELSQDPDALFRTAIPVEELCLRGRRLGDPIESVSLLKSSRPRRGPPPRGDGLDAVLRGEVVLRPRRRRN